MPRRNSGGEREGDCDGNRDGSNTMVAKNLESLRRNVFGGNQEGEKGTNWMTWEKLCFYRCTCRPLLRTFFLMEFLSLSSMLQCNKFSANHLYHIVIRMKILFLDSLRVDDHQKQRISKESVVNRLKYPSLLALAEVYYAPVQLKIGTDYITIGLH
ncbi:hypothetical protein LXL04_007093 [Taraxacum kok-saghyz]